MTTNGYKVGVTREDTEPYQSGGSGALSVILAPLSFSWGGLLGDVKGATGLPAMGSAARDAILRASVHVDGLWGSAVNQAITKRAALGYTLEDSTDSQRRLKVATERLKSYGDGSWARGVVKGLRDFLTTNRGQFIGIERVGKGPKAQIKGIFHLDALRCEPTGNLQYPAVYTSPKGTLHAIPEYDVIHISDMTSPDALGRNIGICAADRAWESILTMCAMTTYLREKISGSRNLAIHFVNGIDYKTLNTALSHGDTQQEAKGYVVYKGSTIVPIVKNEAPTVVTIPLAEIPDGFDATQIENMVILRYSVAIGSPTQDLKPLSGQGLGTGKQTEVLDESAAERGLAAWDKQLMEELSQRVLPETTTVTFSVNDLGKAKREAENKKLRAETRAVQIASGEITALEARQLALDADDLPPEMVTTDATPGGTLTDEQKPLQQTLTQAQQQIAQYLRPVAPQAPQLPATKAYLDAIKEQPTNGDHFVEGGNAFHVDNPGITIDYKSIAEMIESGALQVEHITRNGKIVSSSLVPAMKAKRLTVADLDDDAALSEAQRLVREVRDGG